MTNKNKADKLFKIINSGKMIGENNGLSIKINTPFDFSVSNIENDKSLKFKNITEAVEIISEFAGNENTDKIKQQIINDLKLNSIKTNEPFILNFKIIE